MKRKKNKKYPFWFYLILSSIPVILLVVLELSLNAFNYGNDYNTFVKLSEDYKNYKFFNPRLPQKYFGNISSVPSVIPDGFKKDKDSRTFRVFALGGSTTAGFPHSPNGAFPRLLKNLLQKEYPQHNFEVINLGISAVNSITIRDIIDDVVDEKPDLIIFYAGHNEYYGALGPASNVNGFNSGMITRLILELKEYKIVQLVENLASELISIFAENNSGSKTLMSEIAGRKLVPLDSDLFEDGVKQFSENLEYIFSTCNKVNVPLLVGSLASNLKQQPLCKFVGCDSLSNEFSSLSLSEELLDKNKLIEIKEKDALRFRAPEIFNQILSEKAGKYLFHLVDAKGELEKNSPHGIIGYNLMMDHLHPNQKGSFLIANAFLRAIKKDEEITSKLNSLVKSKRSIKPQIETFTVLDSLYAYYKIEYLLNDFPFVKNKTYPQFTPKTNEEFAALDIINGKLSWEGAHIKMADFYLNNKLYNRYIKEINTLIEDKPFDKFPYLKSIKDLEKAGRTKMLEYIYLKYYDEYPELFIVRKLGDLYFSERNHAEAIYYYEKFLSAKEDAKVYFNLSASYYSQKNIIKSLEAIQNCLKINPSFPNAQKIYNMLIGIYNSKNQ